VPRPSKDQVEDTDDHEKPDQENDPDHPAKDLQHPALPCNGRLQRDGGAVPNVIGSGVVPAHRRDAGTYSTIFQYESLRITLPSRNV
jgi:hypothetical protein